MSVSEGIDLGEIPDVIIAGPPCQGFSTGGGYKAEDPRNSLLLTTCKIISSVQPSLAVIENVVSLTNKRNRNHLDSAIQTLRQADYFCHVQILTASDFGVPQRRRRVLITARKNGNPFLDLVPNRQSNTLGLALSGLTTGVANHFPVFPKTGSRHELIAKRIGPDQKLCNVRAGPSSIPTWEIPECFGITSKTERHILEAIRTLRRRNRKRDFGDADPVNCSELSFECPISDQMHIDTLLSKGYLRMVGDDIDLANTFNGKYRRLSSNGASPTVDTRFGEIQLFLHPTENRSLTVREAARIQGFSDDFRFPSSNRDAFRLIGNAVPPPMALAIALRCKELLQ
jgi:DNA (cytosine-5)-methyltransferase 1